MSPADEQALLILRHNRLVQSMAMVNNQAALDTHHRDGWRVDWSAHLGELIQEAEQIETRLGELALLARIDGDKDGAE